MVRSFLSLLAKKTAATAIVGTVVVFTGTFALASMSETPELPVDGAECVDLVDVCPEEEPETQTDGTDETDETDEGAPLDPIELDDLFGADESGDDESGDDSSEEDDESGEDEKKTAGEDGYRNHGAAVSEAAHECPEGPDHGTCVSAVAKSDAGKKHKHHDGDDDTDEAKADKKAANAEWKADKKAAKAEWKAEKHADKDHSSDDDDDDDDDDDVEG